MCACFDDIVLKIILVHEDQTFVVGYFGKLFQPEPIPVIVFCEVIFAQSVVACTLSAAGKGLLVEWRPHFTVYSADSFVVVTSAVVPQAIIVVDGDNLFLFHPLGNGVEIVGQSCACTSRNKTSDVRFGCLFQISRLDSSVPPRHAVFGSVLYCTVAGQPSVGDSE